MNSAKYIGMSRGSGRTLTDIEHIRQSLADILITPQGSRPIRRAYGSLLAERLDPSQNDTLRLQIKAVCYSVILAWEPRVKLTGIALTTIYDDKRVTDIAGTPHRYPGALSMSVPVS